MFGPAPIRYDIADRDTGIGEGGIGVMRELIDAVGIADAIDERVKLLKMHAPYHESDHVLAFAFNALCGGTCIEDFELRRTNEGLLNALGIHTFPDPTTAGDFCRRFEPDSLEALMEAFNTVRATVWKKQAPDFFEQAILDADGTIVETYGERKEGMDISYDGQWGFHPLLVSLANTQEPLFIENRPGNRPSHEGAWHRFDQAIALVRGAGFKSVVLRGDTDFSQTRHLDRWARDEVQFVFGIDARANMVGIAEAIAMPEWSLLERPAKYEAKTGRRARRQNHKLEAIQRREFRHLELAEEHVAEITYRPVACERDYRVVIVRKTINVTQGQQYLVPETRYFFYITNRTDLAAADLVFFANDRANQEKLITQLKSGVRSLRTPLDNLTSNWAYMVMTSFAWTLKAWLALLLPISPFWNVKHRAERQRILGMEFRTFLNGFIRIPALIVRSGRRIWYRVVAWSENLSILFRAADALRVVRVE